MARRLFVFGAALALSVLAAWQMYLVLAVGGLTVLEGVILALFVDPVRLARVLVRQHAGRDDRARERPDHPARPRCRGSPARAFDAQCAAVPDLQRRSRIACSRACRRSPSRSRRPAVRIASTSSCSAIRPTRTSSSPRRPRSLRCAHGCRTRTFIIAIARRTTPRRPATSPNGCSASAAHYAHMIVLDADSLMTGETLVRLAAAMEQHPDAGLIQTFPVMVNASTPFARVQQFAGRLYGPLIAYGLAWWHGAGQQLLGPQRDHPHARLRRERRPARAERAAPGRRAYPEPRFRRGRTDAARWLGRPDGARARRLIRRVAALAHRIRRARPALVSGQPAAHGRAPRARPALGDAAASCSWASALTWRPRCGSSSCSPASSFRCRRSSSARNISRRPSRSTRNGPRRIRCAPPTCSPARCCCCCSRSSSAISRCWATARRAGGSAAASARFSACWPRS